LFARVLSQLTGITNSKYFPLTAMCRSTTRVSKGGLDFVVNFTLVGRRVHG